MNHSPAATDIIRRYEGCRLSAYPDPASGGDPWTIGYGSTGAAIRKGVVWTLGQALADLEIRLRALDAQLVGLHHNKVTQNQHDAFVSLSYNIGIGSFANSTVLKDHLAKNYAHAALAFTWYNKAHGMIMQGLVNRRHAEALLYLGTR